jgi:high-affinity nickel-transport protein
MNSAHTLTRKCQLERPTRRPVVAMSLFIGALHLVGWVTWIAIVIPQHVVVGAKAYGLGIGITAYALGLRHAFDADHIAAIDNTTRRLMTRGQRPHSVGFWFSLGHSTVVFALSLLIAVGARSLPSQTLSDHSALRYDLSMIGTTVSA